jgi:hypothetical protein
LKAKLILQAWVPLRFKLRNKSTLLVKILQRVKLQLKVKDLKEENLSQSPEKLHSILFHSYTQVPKSLFRDASLRLLPQLKKTWMRLDLNLQLLREKMEVLLLNQNSCLNLETAMSCSKLA